MNVPQSHRPNSRQEKRLLKSSLKVDHDGCMGYYKVWDPDCSLSFCRRTCFTRCTYLVTNKCHVILPPL